MTYEYEVNREAQEKFLEFLLRMYDNSASGNNGNGLVEGVPIRWLQKPKEDGNGVDGS